MRASRAGTGQPKLLSSTTLIAVAITVAMVCYLVGSIPFGYLLVRMFRGVDVRQTGSGNIGATNVARTGSKGLAIVTLVLDALKGYIAVLFAMWVVQSPRFFPEVLRPETTYSFAALAAFCAILGHMFTPWLRFRGGKGVATAVGAFTGIAPLAVLISLVLFLLIVAITRYVSLGSMVGVAVFPFAAWWLNPFTRTAAVMVLMAAASLLIILRHKDNIRRLMAGNENRFGSERKPA